MLEQTTNKHEENNCGTVLSVFQSSFLITEFLTLLAGVEDFQLNTNSAAVQKLPEIYDKTLCSFYSVENCMQLNSLAHANSLVFRRLWFSG